MTTPRQEPRLSTAIGPQIRAARQAQNISLRGLAASLHISPATLSHIENSKAELHLSRLEAIAAELDLSAWDLISETRRAPTSPLGTQTSASPPESVATTHSVLTPTPVADEWRDYQPLQLPPALAAAADEFFEVGYHGTTMRQIASRSGLSVPGIYAHFPSKQSLLVAVLDRTIADLEWRTTAAIATGNTSVERFCNTIENLALYHAHRSQLGFIGASEVRALEPPHREVISQRRGRQQELIDAQVDESVAAGTFRTARPADAARAIVTMCTALPTWWQVGGRLRPEDIAAEYVDFALRIVEYRPAP